MKALNKVYSRNPDLRAQVPVPALGTLLVWALPSSTALLAAGHNAAAAQPGSSAVSAGAGAGAGAIMDTSISSNKGSRPVTSPITSVTASTADASEFTSSQQPAVLLQPAPHDRDRGANHAGAAPAAARVMRASLRRINSTGTLGTAPDEDSVTTAARLLRLLATRYLAHLVQATRGCSAPREALVGSGALLVAAAIVETSQGELRRIGLQAMGAFDTRELRAVAKDGSAGAGDEGSDAAGAAFACSAAAPQPVAQLVAVPGAPLMLRAAARRELDRRALRRSTRKQRRQQLNAADKERQVRHRLDKGMPTSHPFTPPSILCRLLWRSNSELEHGKRVRTI